MLYRPEVFEPLTETAWDEERVRAALRAIVDDADGAFDPVGFWPADDWDGWRAALPLKALYVGAAGVVWALDALRRRGHAESTVDLSAAALRTLEAWRAAPDFVEGYELPSRAAAGLLAGESGILVVAWRRGPSDELADALHARVLENVDNEANELMWGSPGTMLAARALLDWTGEERWADAWRASADELWRRREADGLWAVQLYAFLKAFERTDDERWLDRARRFAVHALEQVERLRRQRGRGRYSLWTGDVGTALFAADCLGARTTYPIVDSWDW